MLAVTIAAAVAAVLCLVLLCIVLKQLSDLTEAVERLPKIVPPPPPAAPVAVDNDRDAGRFASIEQKLGFLNGALRRIEQALADRAPPREDRPAPPVPVPPPPPERPVTAPLGYPQVDVPTAPTPAPVSVPASAFGAVSAAEASEASMTIDQLLDEYRQLLAQPRKNEINRWIDGFDGDGCEIGEDDTLQPLDREAGPLLVLVPFGDQSALVLPSARLVVEFATSFADALSLRGVLRRTFELEVDGTGILRLLDPAMAVKTGGRWRLQRPGRLAGLVS